jgi:hypothetical protein
MNPFEMKTRGVRIIHEPDISPFRLFLYSLRQMFIALPKTASCF